KDNLIKNIQETQDMYINSQELETRLYESRMKTYSERLAEIEERLVNIEVAKALKKAHIKASI
ncbi:MAG: hypothetical protein ACMXYK_03065, partial [Candidatus Woesearchaeota archaeon]